MPWLPSNRWRATQTDRQTDRQTLTCDIDPVPISIYFKFWIWNIKSWHEDKHLQSVSFNKWLEYSVWVVSVYLIFNFLSECLSMCLYNRLSIRIFVCLSVFLSVCPTVYLSLCLFVTLSSCLSDYLSFCHSVYLSFYLFVRLSICPSICHSVYMYVFVSYKPTFLRVKKNENCTIFIPKVNSYFRRKSSARWSQFKVSSERLSAEIDILLHHQSKYKPRPMLLNPCVQGGWP